MTIEFSRIEVIMAVTGALLDEIEGKRSDWVRETGFRLCGNLQTVLLSKEAQKWSYYWTEMGVKRVIFFYTVTLHYSCS